MFSPSILSLALFASTVLSQGFNPSLVTRVYFASITLADPAELNSSITCFRQADQPSSIGFYVYTNYTVNGCHNIATMFGRDPTNASLAIDPTYDCPTTGTGENGTCTSDFWTVLRDNYNPAANYSAVGFRLFKTPVSGYREQDVPWDFSNFTIKAFAGENCEDSATQPWFEWGGCRDEVSNVCDTLPYSIGSIRLEETAVANRTECRIAAQRGAGARGKEVSLVAMAVGLVVAGGLVFI